MARILVVDDAKIIRVMLKKILEDNGHEVVAEAEDGLEAVDFYIKFSPDFVVMDLEMPNVNGLEALKKIKKIDAKAKVLILTSYSDEEIISQSMNCGAKGYLLKPITRDKATTILRIIDSKK